MLTVDMSDEDFAAMNARIAMRTRLEPLVSEIVRERLRQEKKFPNQILPNGTSDAFVAKANLAKNICKFAVAISELTWFDVLHEEFWEAMAETDPTKLRDELVQVAAVACRWIEALDAASEDVCGLCGKPGANKIPAPRQWPGERDPETEFVHSECENEECRRAHQEFLINLPHFGPK